MNIINSIKALPSQSMKVQLTSGVVILTLNYKPTIMTWLCDVQYNSFVVHGIKLSNNINCLEQYSYLIPFGIWITTANGMSPFLIDDFSSGRALLYLLDQADLDNIDVFYRNK